MASESSAAAKWQHLVDLAHEALDQYEDMNSDLSALVSDLGCVLSELEPLATREWTVESRDAWRRLLVVREETVGHKPSELGGATVAGAIRELRRLLAASWLP